MTADQTATSTIEGVNDAPGSGADSHETSEGATLTVTAGDNGLLDNVTDPEGDPVTLSTTLVTNVANGALSISADGSFEYTPGDDFVGTDTFVYQLSDDNGATSTATAQILVLSNTGAPLAVSDAGETDEDTPLSVDASAGVLANDADPDELDQGNLQVAAVNGSAALVGSEITIRRRRVVEGQRGWQLCLRSQRGIRGASRWTVRYSHVPVYGGHPGGLTGSTSVSINVAGVNDAPEATGEEYSTGVNETLGVTTTAAGVLGNDTDIDGDTLRVDTSPLIKVSNGSLVLNDDGTFSYTPDTDFTGTDQFTYRVDDGNGGTSSATATIAVGLNEPRWLPTIRRVFRKTAASRAMCS
ncbi:MAG: Ig-like domain-containing protein [Gammaproteobacteria bacterium]|nr:Ig-like domain-containing protein [Gammaproteobacteria bacterium]